MEHNGVQDGSIVPVNQRLRSHDWEGSNWTLKHGVQLLSLPQLLLDNPKAEGQIWDCGGRKTPISMAVLPAESTPEPQITASTLLLSSKSQVGRYILPDLFCKQTLPCKAASAIWQGRVPFTIPITVRAIVVMFGACLP